MWLFLLSMLLGGLFTIAFGWTVKMASLDEDRRGRLDILALQVAHFPTVAEVVWAELMGYATQTYKEDLINVPREDADLSGFDPIQIRFGTEIPGLLVRADRTILAHGWRVLIGAFELNGEIENAALLLSPDLEVVNVWLLDEPPVPNPDQRPGHRKFVQGIAVMNDASLIFAFDHGVTLQRIDRCGNRQWVLDGNFHHAITRSEDGSSVWSLRGDEYFVEVASASGEILREFSLQDIISRNPETDILEIRRIHANDPGLNSRNTAGDWMEDPVHLNDVEPLPAALADRFEAFEAGDLLVSARSANLIFVIDPDSLEVKWWRVGATQRQHDPDWQPNGEISVYNNRMSRDYSEIISIDPDTFRRTSLFDGRAIDFYSRIRGKHQITSLGHLVITSPEQGRAFEVDRSGDTALEFLNLNPGSDTANFLLSELIWLPPDAISLTGERCEN